MPKKRDNRHGNLAPSPDGQPQREKMGETERKNASSALTFRQQSALPVVAAAPTVAQAARNSGIGESTLYRWLEDDSFRQELARHRQEAADLARQELYGLMLRSVSVISDAMDHPDPTIRLRAARYALSFGAQFAEAERIQSNLRKLEQAIPAWVNRRPVS